jgi:hypothetical protein
MAISLAYTILTAPTVEQELVAHRRRGTGRRYRQQEYGSGSDSGGGGQQQEIYQQEEVTITTPAMTALGTATTVAADWQSVDGHPALRIIPHSALADSPIVLFSPLPAHMAANTSRIHLNGDTDQYCYGQCDRLKQSCQS